MRPVVTAFGCGLLFAFAAVFPASATVIDFEAQAAGRGGNLTAFRIHRLPSGSPHSRVANYSTLRLESMRIKQVFTRPKTCSARAKPNVRADESR
jgi:hypothetical protein